MTEITDTIGVLSLDAWNASDANVLSYIKSPIQNSSFANNSDLIGKTLRQAIVHFADTLHSIDRSACALGNEFRSTRTRTYPASERQTNENTETTSTIEITTLAPIAFEHMRSAVGVTRHDFRASFAGGELINFANTGKSGSQMYKTHDDVYVIKTLRNHEAKLLIQILAGLYLRYSHINTLMARYMGLYSINIRTVFSAEIHCVLMLNNLPAMMDVHEIYDLKGSIVGRLSNVDLPSRRLKALKDLDFESFYPVGIRIPHDIYRRLKHTLESDIHEMKKLNITDFSLMLGIHHLDEYQQYDKNGEMTPNLLARPELGISSLFAATNIDRTIVQQTGVAEETKTKSTVLTPSLIKKFIMKPLHLIACPQANTFDDSTMAKSFSAIPGVTHDGRRVLLYPAFIDCLQTYDSFKHFQHVLQNIRDPKRGAEYSVIHPDEYEKRMIRFLLDKVFIDSKQTLIELLGAPIIPSTEYQLNNESRTSLDDPKQQYFKENRSRESFEIIRMSDVENVSAINDQENRYSQVTETTQVLKYVVSPLLPNSTDDDITESTSL